MNQEERIGALAVRYEPERAAAYEAEIRALLALAPTLTIRRADDD